MDIMNNEKNAYVLTEEEKKSIEACLKPTKTVWVAIKDITKRKYDSYLEQLEPTCNTVDRKSDFSSIRNRWNAVKDDKIKKDEYLQTKQFDDDLIYVLKAFAQRVRGIRTSGPWSMNLKGNINNWKKNPTMKRDTLLKIAVGFGLTINETQELIFSVLSDDEQLDLDPRLANEMIYQYAIIVSVFVVVVVCSVSAFCVVVVVSFPVVAAADPSGFIVNVCSLTAREAVGSPASGSLPLLLILTAVTNATTTAAGTISAARHPPDFFFP